MGFPARPDAGTILESPLCGLPVLSLGASLLFVGWQSPGSSIFFTLCLQLLWLTHVLCAEWCVIDYSGETGMSIDRL